MKRLFISFSGGETSAFMAQWLLANKAHGYDEIVTLFANTGQENEETLRFVQQCDEAFDLNVVWVEAVVDPRLGVGIKHKVVDFEAATRDGSVFEKVISKHGIPNASYPHCTRDLKTRPMYSYMKSIGWRLRTYDVAIGIRADETDRVDPDYKKKRYIYPLISDVEMTKPRINRFWEDMPFRLQLKSYQGNCKRCWKKSIRKHLTLMQEDPSQFDFPEKMEEIHGLSGSNEDGSPRVFFRDHTSTKDIKRIFATESFIPASDDAQVYEDQMSLGFDLDAPGGGCDGESCEPF